METLLVWIGRLAGAVGVLVGAVAAAVRVTGSYWLGGFQLGTLLLGGMAAMMVGCLCFLAVLVNRALAKP